MAFMSAMSTLIVAGNEKQSRQRTSKRKEKPNRFTRFVAFALHTYLRPHGCLAEAEGSKRRSSRIRLTAENMVLQEAFALSRGRHHGLQPLRNPLVRPLVLTQWADEDPVEGSWAGRGEWIHHQRREDRPTTLELATRQSSRDLHLTNISRSGRDIVTVG